MFWAFFDHSIWAIFHSGTFGTYDWKKSSKISSSKKSKISGFDQISSIWIGWILGVANFGFNYLRHFSINFENSCAHLVANFLKFLKLPKHFKFACFSRMLWTKTQKIRNQKICQFEPTLKFNLFGEWDFSTFFFNQMTQKYQNEKSPILNGQKKSKTSEKVQKMRDLEGPTSFRPFENTR